MSRKEMKWQGIIIGFAIITLAWIAYTTSYFAKPQPKTGIAPQKGFFAPDFTLTTLTGETISLSDYYGKAVVLNIWASWCKPCQSEMPAIQEMFERYEFEDVVILAVNATSKDSLGNVQEFIEDYQLTFPVPLDIQGNVSSIYQVNALPTTFFIDSQGLIQEIVIGGPMAEALLDTRIQNLLD
ncbi:MAG: hypothetical protein CVU39_05520 [Chloroflexi bacterium HGW-Chloroflexi-10]|nr:MAG: hypothetical protein CVU39_05520 [Chloroflexi bacterium HGW-Chloroflexi-10]